MESTVGSHNSSVNESVRLDLLCFAAVGIVDVVTKLTQYCIISEIEGP
jgi:hypothetical protein